VTEIRPTVTQLITHHLSDSVLTQAELTEERAAVNASPERDAVIGWVQSKYPGLVPLLQTNFDISGFTCTVGGATKEGIALAQGGMLPSTVRNAMLASLGLDAPKQAVTTHNSAWNFHMRDTDWIVSSLTQLVEDNGGTLNRLSRVKPNFSSTEYITFEVTGTPEVHALVHALGDGIQCRDSGRWRW
jgi:hypothetical protein